MGMLEKYISNLEKELERCSFDIMRTASVERKLLYLYSYYHYFNADNSKLLDVLHGDVKDYNATDYIAGIYIDSDADACDVDAIIVWYVPDNEEFDFPAALKALKDAEAVLLRFASGQTIRNTLTRVISEEDYKFSLVKPLKIRIVTNYCPKNVGKKRSILNALQALKPEKEYTSFFISFGYDIEYEILEIEDPKEYVDDAVIEIDSPNNCVVYGEEQSLLVNVSAKSLQGLYEQYGYRGLFAQNLRYYIKNAKIDESILASIHDTPDLFWYLNNGVIIICDDYLLSGREIRLNRLSIINGGQTTKLIGEAEIGQDFFLQCKIVRNKYQAEEKKIAFIAKVAEASNTQKPIKEKDLIANRPEQRMLKRQLADAGIYCQIKRGEKVNKKLYPAAWQNTTNEELGQFLLSFVYQKPGIARANKASICGNKERYSLLFGKKYNSGLLKDILKIKAYYKQWISHVRKTDDGVDPYKVGLVNNGMFFMTAIVGVLSKYYYHSEYSQLVASTVLSDQKIEILSQHDIDHQIFLADLREEDYYTLFDLCYAYFYLPGYEFLKSFKGRYNDFSNFTKIDNNYKTYVFRQICSVCLSGIPLHIHEQLKCYFAEVSEDDISRDNALLSKYVNIISSDLGTEPETPEVVVSTIKEALVAYRTKTYKANRIKAYEVFKNAACDRIAKHAPTNIDDLRSLHCLDEAQLNLYGEDIVGIVNDCLATFS